MDYNGFKKYFTPINSIPMIIGCFIVACGVILAFMGRYALYMGVVVLSIGACVIVFSRDSRPSDSDVDGAVATRIKDVDESAKEQIDLREKLLKAFPTVSFDEFDFSGYETDPGEFRISRGRDSKYRTNRYSAARIMFAQERLHIYMLKFYLTKDTDEVKRVSEKYTDLSEASVEQKTQNFVMYSGKNEKKFDLQFSTLVIRDNGGNKVIEVPVHDGADVDQAVETINRLIKSKKEGGTVSFS